MRMKTSVIILTTVVVLVLVGIGYWSLTGLFVSTNNYDNFAKCLTEKDVVMYGTYWCSHCLNQKKMFGDSWRYINYVECDPRGTNAKPELCYQNNIEGYPTWIIDGIQYRGERTLGDLSTLSGCSLG